MPNELKPCKCGATPKIKEGYDTLQIVCEHCGEKGKLFVGDYYDEAFMLNIYGDEAIEDWNWRVDNACSKY